MKTWGIIIVGVLIVLIGAGVYTFFPNQAQAPVDQNPTNVGNAAEKADLIVASAPTPNATITSPLVISGQARGTWYFEASFPYQLTDSQGNVIAEGPAVAQGDWMTEDFVPFTATITFPPQPKDSTGILTLKKDNPSGDPVHDDELIIPVKF